MKNTGTLRIQAFAARQSSPVEGVTVTVSGNGFTATRLTDAEGNVVDLLNKLEQGDDLKAYDRKPIILSCGPLPMMKAVADWAAERGIPAQLSMEQRMGCGYGTCVLCTIDTVDGRLKVCSDGPVFTREQLGWGK